MTGDDFVPAPRYDLIQESARNAFPGDDNRPIATARQTERCAALVAAYARGHDGYREALPEVARFRMLAGVIGRARGDADTPELVEAWAAVDAWPIPRQGAPRAQPS